MGGGRKQNDFHSTLAPLTLLPKGHTWNTDRAFEEKSYQNKGSGPLKELVKASGLVKTPSQEHLRSTVVTTEAHMTLILNF